jgi:nicotinate-nucleotide adenylyltransferase
VSRRPSESERLGIFGGTFDPIHVGHVIAASQVGWQLDLDRILMVPAGEPWQKVGSVSAPAEDRVAMVKLACADVDALEVGRLEVDRAGPSVTADTLEALTAPGRSLFLILGADAASNMPTWRRLEETRLLATVVAVERAGEHAEPPGPDWEFVHVSIPRIDVSSSDIRQRLAAGQPIDGLVPPSVATYLRERDLYTAR